MIQVKSTTGKEILVNSPRHLIGEEVAFGKILEKIVEDAGEQFKNQAIRALNKTTIAKFEDAKQDGNFGVVFTKMGNRVVRKINKRFDSQRIKQIVVSSLSKTNRKNRDIIYGRIAKSIGLNPADLKVQEALNAKTNAFMQETTQWVEKLKDDTLAGYISDTLREMSLGKSLEDVLSNFDGFVETRKNHAKFIARNQIATFNSLMTVARSGELGIEKALWDTIIDGRERKCHKSRDGKEFVIADGLFDSCDGKTIRPGEEYSCRCTFRLIIPAE